MKKSEAETANIIEDGTSVLKTIYERRAVRKYTDMPISKTLIEEIVHAGCMAPSAINKQPWKFYILRDKHAIQSFSDEIMKAAGKEFIMAGPKMMIKTIANLLHFPHGLTSFKKPDPIFHGAPVVIFIAAPKDNEWAALDIGMCAQNMMLAAKSLGLDSCPVGLGTFVSKAKHFSQLHIPESEQVLISLILGYGDETPEVHKRAKNNIVYLD